MKKNWRWVIVAGSLPLAVVSSAALRTGDRLHGFEVVSVTELPEVSGRLVRMTFAQNGADLAWLDRPDDNKTFDIAFRTPPPDDSGVAHILEHAVLCGSASYPVKEPFVELKKSSMATYLNAVTWPDRTVYPVATRNDTELLNLMSVYLDAVFHPLCVRDDWILRQEGWRDEFAPDGSLVRNGVVYSEMKGSFASPSTRAYNELKRLLYPDNSYCRVSGGDPAHIPELTFAKFKAFHARYYHPSNARIFLDGQVDIDSALRLLASVLSAYDRAVIDSAVPRQKPVTATRTLTYPGTDTDGKVIWRGGRVIGTFADAELRMAVDVLADYLAGSNEAPLRKALLDAKLCETVGVWGQNWEQFAVVVNVENTATNKVADCRRIIRETLSDLAEKGLDRNQLRAKLDRLEFRLREQDYGTCPRGIAFMNEALSVWNYGGDPADAFRRLDRLARLREKVDTGYFETVLRKILATDHWAEVTLVPSPTQAADEAAEEKRAQAARLAAMDACERAAVAAAAQELRTRQTTPDRPDDLAKVPRLAVADVPRDVVPFTRQVTRLSDVVVVRTQLGLHGLFYLDLAFPLDLLSENEVKDMPLLAALLGHLPTASFSAAELRQELDRCLGAFSVDVDSYLGGSYLTVHVAALDSRRADVVRLLKEVLTQTRFDDTAAIETIRVQQRERLARAFRSSGSELAVRHAGRALSPVKTDKECLKGLAQLRHLQEPFTGKLDKLLQSVLSQRTLGNQVVIGVTDEVPEAFVTEVLSLFRAGDRRLFCLGSRLLKTAVPHAEGLEIPAAIAFSGCVGQLPDTLPYSGAMRVASQILNYDYLWNEVRVKGGAYGAGFSIGVKGDFRFSSYRDPNPAFARDCFRAAGAHLAGFLDSGASIESYQVAAVGRLEPYRSPRSLANWAFESQLAGLGAEDYQRWRHEILDAKPAELKALAVALTDAVTNAYWCVIGDASILDTCPLNTREPIEPQKK